VYFEFTTEMVEVGCCRCCH